MRQTQSLEDRLMLDSDLAAVLQQAVRNGAAGSEQLTDALHDRIYDQVLQQSLPLIGSALHVKDTAADQMSGVSGLVRNAISAVSGQAEVTSSQLQQALFSQLQPLLDGITTPQQIIVSGDRVSDVTFTIPLRGTIVDRTAAFDPGLPSVLVATSGSVHTLLTYDMDLRLGFSSTGAVFVDVSGAGDASLQLNVTSPGLQIRGQLGLLKVTATNAGSPDTGMTATFSIDITDGPDADSRLTVGEIPQLGMFGALVGAATVNLNLQTDLGDASLPELVANLRVDWPIDASWATPSSAWPDAPQVRFNNVGIDAGSFFTKLVQPVFDQIDITLAPIQPVLDVLEERMPVLSDIAPLRSIFDTNHDGQVTLIEAMATSTGSSGLDLAAAVSDFHSLYTWVRNITATGIIPLGSFRVATDPRTVPALRFADRTDIVASDPNAHAEATELRQRTSNEIYGGGFSFPLLTDPNAAFD
ncbi:MAG: hypothetical protein KDA96_21755, partial [Planctomycetaceae bacterium]|nr:hypothetical protein [Planctomycetaceae bacterium]